VEVLPCFVIVELLVQLQRVAVGSYVIDDVLPVPAIHQQLVHDQQEQDEELEVVGDIDTLQHGQTDRQDYDVAFYLFIQQI
jgi:hypothetical protein